MKRSFTTPSGTAAVVVGQQAGQLGRGLRPRDVVPEHRRPVALDQLSQLGLGVGRVVAARLGQDQVAEGAERVVVEGPVEAARVVDAEAHPLAPHGLGQLSDHVTGREQVGHVRVADLGRPQAVAVVVLGDQHHVAGAGGREAPGPVVGIPGGQTGLPVAGELVVGPVAVDLAMVLGHRALGEGQRVLVPLGVRRPGEGVGPALSQQLGRCRRRPARTRAPTPASSARRSRAWRRATTPAPDGAAPGGPGPGRRPRSARCSERLLAGPAVVGLAGRAAHDAVDEHEGLGQLVAGDVLLALARAARRRVAVDARRAAARSRRPRCPTARSGRPAHDRVVHGRVVPSARPRPPRRRSSRRRS